MGRGRAKSKKQSVVAPFEDTGSGEVEKIPVYKRRGRPQKVLDDHHTEDELVETTKEDNGDVKVSIASKDVKNPATGEKGRKRKRSPETKEEEDSVKEENGVAVDVVASKSSTDDLRNNVGFRQAGSRRKNKPRRAAEVGVECR